MQKYIQPEHYSRTQKKMDNVVASREGNWADEVQGWEGDFSQSNSYAHFEL